MINTPIVILCCVLFIQTVWLALTWYHVTGVFMFVSIVQIAIGPVGITPGRFRCRSS